MDERKRCFRCDKIKPLYAFNVNRVPKGKKTCATCKKCMIKHTSQDMQGIIYNFDTGKFEVKIFKTKKEIKQHYEREITQNGAQEIPILRSEHKHSSCN